MSTNAKSNVEQLHAQVDAILSRLSGTLEPGEAEAIQRLAQELALHQSELALQNEELSTVQMGLQAARDRFSTLYQQAPVGYVLLDAVGIVRQSNQTWLKMLGRELEDVRDRAFVEHILAEDVPLFLSRFRAFFRNPQNKQLDLRMLRYGAPPFVARLEARPQAIDAESEHEPLNRSELLVAVSDVSDLYAVQSELAQRRQELERLSVREQRLNAILRALRNVSKLIHREQDAERLIQGACQELTANLSYHRVWIALFERDGARVRAVESSSRDSDFRALQTRILNGAIPECLRRALAAERAQVVREPAKECLDCPLSELYVGRAGLARALRFDGLLYGVIVASVPASCTDEEEVQLFEELSDELAHALHKLDREAQLAEARRRYLEIFEGSRDGFVIVDQEGRFLDANPAYCAMLGYSFEELRALGSFYEVTHERWHASERLAKAQLVVDGRSSVYEKEYLRRDGSVFPVEVQAYAIRDQSGELDYIWAIVRDITERKEAKAALEASEKMFYSAFEQASVGRVLTNIDGSIARVNRTFCVLLGYPYEEMVKKSFLEVTHPDDRESSRDVFQSLLSGEASTRRLEKRYVHRDGREIWADVSTNVIRDEEGRAQRFVTDILDISERKQAEDALRAEQRWSSTLLSLAPNIVVVLGEGSRIERFNEFAEQCTGYRAEEVLGQSWIDTFIPEAERAAVREVWDTLLELKAVGQEQVNAVLSRSGAQRWIRWRNRVLESDGRFRAILSIGEDITEQRLAQKALQESERRFQSYLEHAPYGVFVADERGRYREVNSPTSRITGWTQEELLQMGVGQLLAPEHQDLAAAHFAQVVREGAAVREMPFVHRSGAQRWWSVSAVKLNEQRFLGFVQDITERKQAEQELAAAFQQLGAANQQLRASNQQLSAAELQLRQINVQLRDSEERFRTIYHNVSVGIAKLSSELRIEQANPALCAILGYFEDELRGRLIDELCTADQEDFQRLRTASVEHLRSEWRFERRDAERLPCLVDLCRVRDEATQSQVYLLSLIDISVRRRAEESLRESVTALSRKTRELEYLLDGARAVLEGGDFEQVSRRVFDHVRLLTGAQSGYVALLDEHREENNVVFLEAAGAECCVDPSLPMPVRGLRELAYTSGEVVWDNDFAASKWAAGLPEGHTKLHNVMFAPLIIEAHVVGLLGLANKPTPFTEEDRAIAKAMGQIASLALQRSRSEQSLLSERDNLQRVLETVPVAILVLDEQGEVIRINPTASQLFGASAEELHGKRCGDVMGCVYHSEHPEGCSFASVCADCTLHQSVELSLRGEAVPGRELEIDISTEDGVRRQRHLLVNAAPVRYGGESCSILAIHDLSESHELRARLAQADRLSSMGLLAAGVAHEINNPLSYVMYNLQSSLEDLRSLAKQPPLPWPSSAGLPLLDVEKRMEEAYEGAQRIHAIARGLGSFSRVECDEPGPIYVSRAVDIAVNMARNELKYRARLQLDHAKTPAVMASEGRLAQVILNLLINAAHAIDEGDADNNQIGVVTRHEGDSVTIRISDTGSGIRPEDLARIFEPFFSTKVSGKGSGLGLAISKGIIESYGGSIAVASELGKGTQFCIRLPMITELPEKPKETSSEVQHDIPTGRVLIIDDEEPLRNAMRRMLRGNTLVLAGSAEEAMTILRDERDFDVILCDMMMPHMSGMEFHQWLCSTIPELGPRLIFITGGSFTPRVLEYLGKVDNIRIEKPFDVTNFKKIVAERIRNRG
ncbi:MAG: PAS domain S-box protein [Myxococcota bacterium]|jgi:PAS domain S-box-containing protein|nr:PAS domain S-box protein [Myxococcota bacterium]